MLFTRCPVCQTNFRITADALRMADGQVKCGQCAAVFNAYEELRDGGGARPSEDLGGTATSTSEAEGPAAAAPPDEEPPLHDIDSLSETDEYPSLDADVTAGDDEWGADEFDDADELGVLTEEEEESLAARSGSDAGREPTLEFDIPQDEWTKFFEHAVEDPLDEQPPKDAVTAPPRVATRHSTLADDDLVVGEALDGSDPAEDAVSVVEESPPVVTDEAADAMIAEESPSMRADDDAILVEEEPPADMEEEEDPAVITEEGPPVVVGGAAVERYPGDVAGVPAAASEDVEAAMAELESIEDLEVEPDQTPEAPPAPSTPAVAPNALLELWERLSPYRWSIGSSALLVLLLLQSIHHFRAPLASQPLVGSLLQATYSMTGTEIIPEWDLSQYEIMDWVATADAATAGPGSLRISARIHNRGPRAQPYPNVRLELKDRWEATVGSRVFTADEYLPRDLTRQRIMEAGTTVPASLEVVDPGQDAYGFELDICAEVDGGGLRCASDTVFQ